jgi:hypothetical protein
MNEIEFQNKSIIYASLRINFSLWHIVGGIYGYKKLIRLPRKQKKALKKSLLQDIFTVDINYLKECPKPKKMPIFSYKQFKK